MAYWRDYIIASRLLNIQKAIGIMSETLNAKCKILWPEVVHDYKGFSPGEVHHSAVNEAVKLAKLPGGDGFDDINPEDINDLINAHSQPLTDEDLMGMTKSASEEEEQGIEEEDEVGLTLDRLTTMIRMAREPQRVAQGWDSQILHSLQFSNIFEGGMSVYKNLLVRKKQRQQQLPMTMLLTRKKTPVTPASLEKTEARDESEKTAPPDEVAPSEQL
ncbi:unnamed protein product [Soboliphyme baturini]|uniref:Pecanex-like protein n=1 Tax=Soboliphyme baturini TaxID=241478 RepID=A0A183IVC3_9BILA|nr:unnamed protein product [Soboliphyme baturini]